MENLINKNQENDQKENLHNGKKKAIIKKKLNIENFMIDYDSKQIKSTKIMIPGSEGLLEGVITMQPEVNAPIALILPPDPKHNGTMNNKIVNMLYHNFKEAKFNTLKINFRGVGLSQGKSKANTSEIEDALTALDWMLKKCERSKTKTPKIWIAGYSFGAWIALHTAMRRPEVTAFISIAAPFQTHIFNMLTPCPNGMIIHATEDKTVSTEHTLQFKQELITQKGCLVNLKLIEDNHYFANKQQILNAEIKNYIKEQTIIKTTN